VEGVEIKGVGSGWSRQTCQLHTSMLSLQFSAVSQYCGNRRHWGGSWML